MERIALKTANRVELIDITGRVQDIVAKSRVNDGVCFIFCPHTTAGLTVNENADPSVKHDIMQDLERLVPKNASYTHAEGNTDAHIKSSLFGSSLTIFIEAGSLVLGTWQGIYFCEGDGPRSREVWIKISR